MIGNTHFTYDWSGIFSLSLPCYLLYQLYDTHFVPRISWSIHACFTPFKLRYAAFVRENMCQISHIVHIVTVWLGSMCTVWHIFKLVSTWCVYNMIMIWWCKSVKFDVRYLAHIVSFVISSYNTSCVRLYTLMHTKAVRYRCALCVYTLTMIWWCK